MLNLDLELQKICEKCGLWVNKKEDENYYEFLNAFQEVWGQIPDEEPIAFYGFGAAFNHMYNRVENNPKNVVCIIENFYCRFSDLDIPIIATEQMSQYKFNKIILTGFAERYQMRRDIAAYDSSIEIIDIYEILEKRGRRYDEVFCERTIDGFYLDYLDLESARINYEKSSGPEEARKNLKLLIQAYLQYRDFVYANFYIEEYIDRRYDDSHSFARLKIELARFFEDVKEKIKVMPGKNVFTFVLDALSFDASKRMPFLEKLSENSLSFCNAFSSGFNTRSFTYSLLTGKSYVEDEIYKIDKLKKEDSGFLLETAASGCKVKHISTGYFIFLCKINDYKAYGTIQPILYWNLLTEILSEPGDCVYFIHSMESHKPYYSGHPSKALLHYTSEYRSGACTPKFEGTPEEISRQRYEHVECLKQDVYQYVDRQLEFYLGFLNLDKDAVIIASDHLEDYALTKALDLPFTLDMQKVSLIIHSNTAKTGVYEDIYSTINMSSLLRQLIRGEKELKISRIDYARQEQCPFYGKNLKREDFSINAYGYVNFVTNTEKYIFYLDGSERYYLLPDFKNNLIEDERYRQRIDYFRSQINIDTRDVWRFMFKKYPQLLKIHEDRAEELLNEDKNPKRLLSCSS